MKNYRCQSCGKLFDPEKMEICPSCGAAPAPSVMTRIERKQTAQRLRAEGKFNYDEHCHEEDSWKGSYGASTHREAVRAHEEGLRAGYHAHQGADVTTRDQPAPVRTATSSAARRSQSAKKIFDKNPALLLVLIFVLPLILFILLMIVPAIIEAIERLGSSSFYFP